MTVYEQVQRTRTGVGIGPAGHLGVVSVGGPDRFSFLQAQLPADVEALDATGCRTAYLDRKGRVQSHLLVLPLSDGEIVLLTDTERVAALIDTLETYHFAEDLTFIDRSGELAVLAVTGPEAPLLLADAAGHPVDLTHSRTDTLEIAGASCPFLADPWSGDPGGWLLVPDAGADPVLERLTATAVPLSPGALEVLRIEGGRPRWAAELAEGVLLPEIDPASTMVSYEKGCYIGQEVVARIHSRGHVNRVLAGLLIEGETVPEPGTPVRDADGPVGSITSACWSPTLSRPVALAFLASGSAVAGTSLLVGPPGPETEPGISARAAELPFHAPADAAGRAVAAYAEGMEHFREDRYESAAAAFQRAARLDPAYEDAWEALGVSCDRMGDLDGAIEVMQELVRMAPGNLMGWSNLSQYFGRQGRIEEAEAAQARALRISMERQMGAEEAERESAAVERERRERLEGRVDTFREVLVLDPDDVIANFGLGKILLDLERYAEAEPCFRRAIAGKPDYSMAFNHLGTALAGQGRDQEAAAVFQEGIAVAARRGDLMPKREMERRLGGLEGAAPAP